jgi:hypothetical protein
MSDASGTNRSPDAIPAKAGIHGSTVRALDEWTPTVVGVVPITGVAQ